MKTFLHRISHVLAMLYLFCGPPGTCGNSISLNMHLVYKKPEASVPYTLAIIAVAKNEAINCQVAMYPKKCVMLMSNLKNIGITVYYCSCCFHSTVLGFLIFHLRREIHTFLLLLELFFWQHCFYDAITGMAGALSLAGSWALLHMWQQQYRWHSSSPSALYG